MTTSLSSALGALPTVTPTKDYTIPVSGGGPVGKTSIQALATVIQALITGSPSAPSGSGGGLLVGTVPPTSLDGADTDVWLNVTTGDVYKKASNIWALQGNIKGPPGQNGTGGGTVDSASIINALTYTPAAVTGANLGANAPTFRANAGFTEVDLIPASVMGVNQAGDYTPFQTQTIDTIPAALTASGTDTFLVSQPSKSTGNSLVAQTFAGALSYFLGSQASTVALNGNTTLDFATHNRCDLIANTALTLSLPGTFIGDGFQCWVTNRSNGNLVLGSGIIPNGGSPIISPNKAARIVAIGAATTGAGNEVRASIMGQGTSSSSITVDSIANGTSTVPFTVSGSLFGYSSTPTLQYQDNSGSFNSLPVGANVTASGYAFTHPGMSTSTGNTITIKDGAGVTAASNSFDVTAAGGATIAAKTPASQPFVSSSGTNPNVTLTADLSGYGSAPTLQYSLNGGTTYQALPGGATVSTSAASFTLTTLAAGSYQYRLTDGTVQSNTVSFTVEKVTLSTVPTTGFTGTALTGANAALTGINTAYAVLYTGGSDQGTRQAFTGTSVPNLTPASAASYTLRVYDAPTSGNLLAESAAITVSNPTITVATPGVTGQSATMSLSGTYAGPAPTGVDARFPSGTNTYAATTSFVATGGSWVGNTVSPSNAGTHTVQVREANATGVTATSGSFTITSAFPASPAGNTLILAIEAHKASGSFFSDTGATVQANNGDAVAAIKDRVNNYLFVRSGAGNGPILTANAQNGLPGLVSAQANVTRGLVCTDTGLLTSLKNNQITVVTVCKYDTPYAGRLLAAGKISSLENNSMMIGPHVSSANLVSTFRNGTTTNQLTTAASGFPGQRLILVNRFPAGLSGVLRCNGKVAATDIAGSLTLAGSNDATAWDYMALFRNKAQTGGDIPQFFLGSAYAIYIWAGSSYATDSEVTGLVSTMIGTWG